MSYNTLASMQEDSALYRRLVACAAEEQKPGSPYAWVTERIWRIVTASSDWEASWAYAEAVPIENIGADESVITDAMILAVIQPMDAPEPEPEPEPEVPPVDPEPEDVPST
jgi:hypothetical protein